MIEREPKDFSELDRKIATLSPLVTDSERLEFKNEQTVLLGHMSKQQQAELLTHKLWLKKQEQAKTEKTIFERKLLKNANQLLQ